MDQSTLDIKIIKESTENLLKDNEIELVNLISNKQITQKSIQTVGGVYAFWWTGNTDKFKEAIKKCDYKLKGKRSQKELINIIFLEEWIDASTHYGKICLYIGKSTDIRSRVSKHLKLQTRNIWGNSNEGKKPNSESQLRIGIEKVFNKNLDNEIIKNISLTWVELNKYGHGVNRFYIEDRAIGKYFPLFNIDIER